VFDLAPSGNRRRISIRSRFGVIRTLKISESCQKMSSIFTMGARDG